MSIKAILTGQKNSIEDFSGILPIEKGGTGNALGLVQSGQKTGTTLGIQATAEGIGTTASGNYAHAEGNGSTASGGSASHAEGISTTSSANGSHAEGGMSTASGTYSHAEGHGTTASGHGSHVEGRGTAATESAAHAEGMGTTASGTYSHAEGYGTIAAGEAQHASGKYNVSNTTSLEIIGNGTSDSARSNARTLDASGNEWLAGKLTMANPGTGTNDAVTHGQLNTELEGVVKTTGNQTVNGIKTFPSTTFYNNTIVIQKTVEKGTAPEAGVNHLITAVDQNGYTARNRIGVLNFRADTDGAYRTVLSAYSPISDTDHPQNLEIRVDAAENVTTTIPGVIFTQKSIVTRSDVIKGTAPADNVWRSWYVLDNTKTTASTNRIGGVEIGALSDGRYQTSLRVYKPENGSSDQASIALDYYPDGTITTRLPGIISGNGSGITNINAGNIADGILPISRGGTGQSSIQAVRNAMGLGNTTGALPVANGGTGRTTMSYVNAVPVANADTPTNSMRVIRTASGAFYATAQDGSPAFGTLPIAQGGTGLTASPSILINLASTDAANVLQASPRPGITGTLPAANGGTGLTSLNTFVRTTGNQSIAGTKTFTDYMSLAVGIDNRINISNGTNASAQIRALSTSADANNTRNRLILTVYNPAGVSNGSNAAITIDNNNGTMTTTINHNVSVSGNLTSTDTITATAFSGDGSSLTNIDPSNLSTTVPVKKGGTGRSNAFINGVLIGNSTPDTEGAYTTTKNYVTIAPQNGALYATGNYQKPQFGILPIAQGGTGASTVADALTALSALSANITLTTNLNNLTTNGLYYIQKSNATSYGFAGNCFVLNMAYNNTNKCQLCIDIPTDTSTPKLYLRYYINATSGWQKAAL